mmetsp:Transcript_43141/g.85449  ORF Transcript_43141/g.85449 Transcript_43141/m.85449 type:complete len:239 (-) Transcript_43141:2380-3096(-)
MHMRRSNARPRIATTAARAVAEDMERQFSGTMCPGPTFRLLSTSSDKLHTLVPPIGRLRTCVVDLPLEFAIVIHVEFAGRFWQAFGKFGVMLLEETAHFIHTIGAFVLAVDAIPEAATNACVQFSDVFLLVLAIRDMPATLLGLVGTPCERCVPEVVVVNNADKLIQHNLSCFFVAVGAVWSPRCVFAMATRHALYAFWILRLHHIQAVLVWVDLVVRHTHCRARARQRVPDASTALV